MNKLIIKTAFLGMALFVVLQSCKKSSKTEPPIEVPDQTFTQSFESMTDAVNQGWVFKNLSDDPGFGWSVEDETLFYGDQPFDGSKLLYGNYQASLGCDIISDWAISPKLLFQNGDKISFYALSNGAVDNYPDRLQLRLNTFNTSADIGEETSSDVGKFTKPLIDINPLYSATPEAFPYSWTKYEATITGLNKPDSGRFAIRYFVELHGCANGDELAVDKVEFTSVNH